MDIGSNHEAGTLSGYTCMSGKRERKITKQRKSCGER